MNEQDTKIISNIAMSIMDTLIVKESAPGALHCAAALGLVLSSLADSAGENSDAVFAFGLDTAVKIYENRSKN